MLVTQEVKYTFLVHDATCLHQETILARIAEWTRECHVHSTLKTRDCPCGLFCGEHLDFQLRCLSIAPVKYNEVYI